MIFTLEETNENILQEHSKTCSKDLIGKDFFVESMYKNKYQKTKIKSCKFLMEANFYEDGQLQARRNRGAGWRGRGVAAASPRFLPSSIFYELKKNSVKAKSSTKLQS